MGVQQLVACRVGGADFAFPIHAVREIIRHSEPQPIAERDSWSRGIVDLRGTAMPVNDLADILGRARGETQGDQRVVVTAVGVDAAPIGWLVDEVDEVLVVDDEAIESIGIAASSMVRQVAHLDGGRLLPVLDVDQLLGVVIGAATAA